MVAPAPSASSADPPKRRAGLHMWYVYVLKSQTKERIYTGFTSDLKRRLCEHNTGKVSSTKSLRPLEIIYYEAFRSKKDARNEEKFLKSGYGREVLHEKIKHSFDLKQKALTQQ